MKKILPILFLLFACGKADLALINAVKTFESHMQDINENLNFLDRNINIANKKYPADLKELGTFVSNNPADTTKSVGFELQYKRVMLEKDKLELSYRQTKREFEGALTKFNDWQGKLMKNKLDNDQAKLDFAKYEKQFQDMEVKISELKKQLTENIAKHNNLTHDKAFSMGNYNNFHIEAH